MHKAIKPAFFMAALLLSSCSSSTTPESLVPTRPSRELTSSIQQAPPVPAASVGGPSIAAASQPQQHQEVLAWAGPTPSGHTSMAPAPMETMTASRTAPLPASETTVGMPGTPLPLQRPAGMIETAALSSGTMSAAARSRIYSRQFRDAKPINFGKVQPRHFAVHGVDVSRWQGEIDWPKLRTQGANFAYIKATDGGDHLDPMFRTNWRRAKEAGIRRGAYHFFYWCRTAGEQADWFIRNVPREPDALPPVIDVEYNGESACKMRLSKAKVIEKMQVFMDKLERHYGQRPVIYTAPDFYKDNLRGEFENYPFWLRAVAQHPSKVYPDRKWVFWQYSGSGLSHGVTGKIDLNVFNGSEQQWHNWLNRQRGSGGVASR
ncbi:glycosyl hydrolase [Rhizobiales bacterium RZME27]|jgi:lysozyme|uniref:Glycosyl hydrolase n=1 Tax=Endobacterium cereale TaxID=2663029 RepID=A0A6A8A4T8_9HYPH|nr:GH25 family lysozyme [Endobacterium cereale]MEB2844904.1 GH25 family lysozyme [Endobacterium cereale]MQY44817.1 glycosyl hydrolase [Endobacterium cereale]